MTISKQIQGTPSYFAPEVVEHETFSTASDIYALGITLFYLATGKAPFSDCETYAKTVLEIMKFDGIFKLPESYSSELQ